VPNDTPIPRNNTNRAIGSKPGAGLAVFRLSVNARIVKQRIAVARNSVKKAATDVMYDI
jgi:hypothetical protein